MSDEQKHNADHHHNHDHSHDEHGHSHDGHNTDHHHHHDHDHGGHDHEHSHGDGAGHHHDHEHGHHHHHDEHGHDHHHHHDDHDHDHHHDDDHSHGTDSGAAAVPENLKKNVALLDYMLNHNRDHAGELADMAKKLREAGLGGAADLVEKGVADFNRGNEKLAGALDSIRGGK